MKKLNATQLNQIRSTVTAAWHDIDVATQKASEGKWQVWVNQVLEFDLNDDARAPQRDALIVELFANGDESKKQQVSLGRKVSRCATTFGELTQQWDRLLPKVPENHRPPKHRSNFLSRLMTEHQDKAAVDLDLCEKIFLESCVEIKDNGDKADTLSRKSIQNLMAKLERAGAAGLLSGTEQAVAALNGLGWYKGGEDRKTIELPPKDTAE